MAETIRTRLTREGWLVALLTLGFLAGAINTGTNLLYLVAAILLGTFGAQLLVVRRALRGLVVTRRAPARVVQGERFRVTYGLRDARGRSRAFPVEVDEVLAEGGAGRLRPAPRALFLGLTAGEAAEARAPARATRRGLVEAAGLRLTSRAPFNLLERTRAVAAPWPLLVGPRVRPVRPEVLAASAAQARALARQASYTPERRDVVRSLRELRPGDDRRSIHWRVSARLGDLVVKEFERTEPDAAAVLLDLAPAGPETVDAAVELAVSVFAALARRGERTALGVTGCGPPLTLTPAAGPAAVRRAQDLLAGVEPDAGAPDWAALARRLGASLRGARTLVVTTRPDGGARVAAAGVRDARVLLVDGPAAAEPCYAAPAPPGRPEEAAR